MANNYNGWKKASISFYNNNVIFYMVTGYNSKYMQ